MPLFNFLTEMNKGNFSYVDDLSDEDVKKLSPYVLSMWVGGATDASRPYRTIATANVCTPYVFSLSKHPRLLLKLYVAANGGISDGTRYKFHKSVSKNTEKTIMLFARYYECGWDDAEVFMSMATDERIKQIHEWADDNDITWTGVK